MADEDEDKDKDKDKKPRYKMGADELVQETHGSVKEIINLLDSKGLAQESVEHLTTLDNKLDFMGALNLASRLGFSMPDVPHRQLVAMLLDAWDCVMYKTGHARKLTYRKVSFALTQLWYPIQCDCWRRTTRRSRRRWSVGKGRETRPTRRAPRPKSLSSPCARSSSHSRRLQTNIGKRT
ncbi:unnamed protein product [Ascophyllum nodosum]